MIGSNAIGMAATTWTHQRLIRNILYNYIQEHGTDEIEVLPEVRLTEHDPNDLQPDIAWYDISNGLANANALVVLEIAMKKQIDSADFQRKIAQYMSRGFIDEIFVYEYTKGTWTKFGASGSKQTSYSNALGIKLADYIHNPNNNPPSLSGTPTYPQKPIVLL